MFIILVAYHLLTSVKCKGLCIDPDNIYLEQKLSEFKYSIDTFKQYQMKYGKSAALFNQQDLPENFKFNVTDNSQCDIQDLNMKYPSQMSNCPRRVNVHYRPNRYPFYKPNTTCSCESCILHNNMKLSKELYKCLPVWREEAVLTRELCQDDGYYYWKTDFEWVNIGCTCGTQIQMIPYR
ncbi:unnamed protein product [Brachionus calyciflorus]|uniref:Uncharacterized protein n=1 Tax=Brachionus calyciflorus TaxID=104777 RepID=A0A813QKE8_9BILA|nr:unnamed protein product [Brachionus calyciflorus]